MLIAEEKAEESRELGLLEIDQKIPSRVVIDRIEPRVDGGRFAVKRYLDEPVEIRAVIITDGHDQVKARLLYRHEDSKNYVSVPMTSAGNDIWSAEFRPEKLGRYSVNVEAALDRFGTWCNDLFKKIEAGQKVDVDLRIGVGILNGWRDLVDEASKVLIDEKINSFKALLTSSQSLERGPLKTLLFDDHFHKNIALKIFDERSRVRWHEELPIQVEPKLARFSSWYELFPRSFSAKPGVHGTFKDVERLLPYVKKMGFDILYLPPIHPIGKSFRKGKNNSLQAGVEDVGSPWAIGYGDGGHRDLHPELGTLGEFKNLIQSARQLGIEIAMDIAFQCSPDHPYVKQHPEWFKKRPDGGIQYAENPPKKYQDIYPFDFECEQWRSLWQELKHIVEIWVKRGVKVFRVDNPHTKPFHFWEWLISSIKRRNPEVIFLSEAFTRPHVMSYLAKLGFSQSYTYFTWRNSKAELTQYLNELTQTEHIEYFVANFWPNTPDILPLSLQSGDRAVFMQRLILAATLSSSYGIYGPAFELMDHRPKEEESEEYLDSEKYQIRQWDIENRESLQYFIATVNFIRNKYRALQSNRKLRFHKIENEKLLAYSKSTHDGENLVIIVNLDPHHVQSGMLELPLNDWGINPEEAFQVHDLLTDTRYFWSGWLNYVELNPQSLPAHIFLIRPNMRSVSDFEYFA